MEYPSATHLKLKSRKILFVKKIRFSCPIDFKFYTEHDSSITVLWSIFQNYYVTDK